LYDIDGHAYIDFLSEYSAGLYGHNPRAIQRAIALATDHGWALGGNNIHQTKLAKMIVERFGNSMDMVRFTNSGTEANLMAIGAALNVTGRDKVS
jgi:glutamate-1-semialdehyde 2,1-aminomutase